MSYLRIYPSKNNTIFHYTKQVIVPPTVPGNPPTYNTVTTSDTINCGANPIMELMDGHGESKLLWAFDLPNSLIQKLTNRNYLVKLQLFDAGTLFRPPINLKQIDLESFTVDFAEGDGYSFLPPENKVGVSNWIQADSITDWSGVVFTPVTSYHLNSINEDLNFDVTFSIQTFISDNNYTPRYSLRIDNRTDDPTNVFVKYIYSNYTKTVFKPYLEFFIEDSVIDKTFNCIANEDNKIYLLNHSYQDFSGSVIATVTYQDNSVVTPTVTNNGNGEYYITIHPPLPTTIKKTYVTILWTIGGLSVQKQIIQVCTPDKLLYDNDVQNLYFYPSTSYSHNIVRQGDIIPFTVVSQIRGQGDIVNDTYEYKITSADGFEMIPWSSVNVYRKKMYFYVDTSYFYPEQQYEVWLRNNVGAFIITSNFTHKFKLAMNDKSHLRELSTSPYYNREQFISK